MILMYSFSFFFWNANHTTPVCGKTFEPKQEWIKERGEQKKRKEWKDINDGFVYVNHLIKVNHGINLILYIAYIAIYHKVRPAIQPSSMILKINWNGCIISHLISFRSFWQLFHRHFGLILTSDYRLYAHNINSFRCQCFIFDFFFLWNFQFHFRYGWIWWIHQCRWIRANLFIYGFSLHPGRIECSHRFEWPTNYSGINFERKSNFHEPSVVCCSATKSYSNAISMLHKNNFSCFFSLSPNQIGEYTCDLWLVRLAMGSTTMCNVYTHSL